MRVTRLGEELDELPPDQGDDDCHPGSQVRHVGRGAAGRRKAPPLGRTVSTSTASTADTSAPPPGG